MSNPPSLPFAGQFTFHDCWTAVDVEMNGKGFLAKNSCACTLYTRECFPGSQQIQTTMTVLDFKDAIVGFGLLGERATEPCRTNCVGHSDILDSIGCAVGRGEAIIVFKGKTLFRAPVQTGGRAELGFELINGRACFLINGQRLNCPDLAKLNLSKGRFRLGVSPTKAGQAGVFGNAQQIAAMSGGGGGGGGGGAPAGGDDRAPYQQYNPTAGFTFHDRWRSMDIVNGRSLICRHSVKGTSYSEQVFKGSTNFRVTLRLGNRAAGGIIGLGVVGQHSTKQTADYVCGEKEIPDSVGALVKENSILVVFKDDIVFNADVQMVPNPEIAVIFKDGKLRFELDGRNLNCEKLKELNFGDGHFRIGASLTEEGQTAELLHIGNDSSGDPDAPASYFDPNNGWILHDRWRSMDVVNNTAVVCRNSVKGTTYSKAIFRGSMDFRADLVVKNKGNDAVLAFGVLGFNSTRQCADYVLGEKEIPDSIGVIIKGGTLAVMFKDDIVFQAEPGIPANPTLSVIFTGGKIKFEMDGRNLNCEKLNGLNFSGGQFRIGVSMTQEGQSAELAGAGVGGSGIGTGGGGGGGDGGGESNVPAEDYDGGRFTLHDRWQSMDVVQQTKLICRKTIKGTTYTEQIFRGNFNFKSSFKFTKVGGGVVAFGILGQKATKETANYVLGEKEIPDSIGCIIRGNTIAIMFKDEVVFQADVQVPPQPVLTVILQGGDLRFEMDGRNLDCDKIRELNFGGGRFRLGVSMTEEGQAGHFVGADGADPTAMKEDVIEGEKDVFYKWAFDDAHASRNAATVTSKERGGKAFSLQVFSTTKMPDTLICDACFRGDANRRKFDCHRWKADKADDFDLCNDCYHFGNVKAPCERKDFTATLGGSFHEIRFVVDEMLGNTIDFGITARGAEDSFGNDNAFFVTGGPSGWTRGKMTLNGTPMKQGDEIWVRVFGNKLLVFCNKVMMLNTNVEEKHYRFAARFGRDGQSLRLIRRLTMPPRGTPVEVSPDRKFLDQEASLVGLDPAYLKEGVRGWIIDEDNDGTVKLCLDDTTTPTVWVPRTTVLPIRQRIVPTPSSASLANGQKVVRNLTCWVWGQQDGNIRGNRIGQVLETDKDSWVKVRWSNGTENSYSYVNGLFNVLAWVGNVGDRVVRNPAAFAGGNMDQYGQGTVSAVSPTGVLTVSWDNGTSGEYRFNEEAQEVQLAGAMAVPPLSEGSSPWAAGATPVATSPASPKNAPGPAMGNSPQAPPQATTQPTDVRPPPGAPAPPPPADAAERFARAEVATMSDVGLKPAMMLKKSYKPPKPLKDCMMDAQPALPKVGEMEYIVEQSVAIAADRRKSGGNLLELDEALAIVLYTFDIGPMSEFDDGSDNFYFVLNEIFRSRDSKALIALQPFMYFFKMAWNRLPNIEGQFYRGIPKSALEVIKEQYAMGREVHWSSVTSLSVERDVATAFAKKEGPGGVLMEITVCDSRSISKYSAIPREGEVILEPNTKLIVTQAVTPAGPFHILKLVQVKQSKAFVF